MLHRIYTLGSPSMSISGRYVCPPFYQMQYQEFRYHQYRLAVAHPYRGHFCPQVPLKLLGYHQEMVHEFVHPNPSVELSVVQRVQSSMIVNNVT